MARPFPDSGSHIHGFAVIPRIPSPYPAFLLTFPQSLYYLTFILIYLAAPGLNCSMQNLFSVVAGGI